MKVSIALAFEEQDDLTADYTLHFVDGTSQVLSHVTSQIVVDLATFDPAGAAPNGDDDGASRDES